jgi:hypothetical protein
VCRGRLASEGMLIFAACPRFLAHTIRMLARVRAPVARVTLTPVGAACEGGRHITGQDLAVDGGQTTV